MADPLKFKTVREFVEWALGTTEKPGPIRLKGSHHSRLRDMNRTKNPEMSYAEDKQVKFFEGMMVMAEACLTGVVPEFLTKTTTDSAYALNTLRAENDELKARLKAIEDKLAGK